MPETIEAIYENGTFKPLHPVDLPEGTRVTIAAPAPSAQTDEAFLQKLIADGASREEAEKILANFRLLWESYDMLTEEQKASLEQARIAIRPVRLSAAEAQRRALRYVLTTLGDALSLSAPSLLGQNAEAIWAFTVSRKATGESCGELRLNAETGEVIAWLPTASTPDTVFP